MFPVNKIYVFGFDWISMNAELLEGSWARIIVKWFINCKVTLYLNLSVTNTSSLYPVVPKEDALILSSSLLSVFFNVFPITVPSSTSSLVVREFRSSSAPLVSWISIEALSPDTIWRSTKRVSDPIPLPLLYSVLNFPLGSFLPKDLVFNLVRPLYVKGFVNF